MVVPAAQHSAFVVAFRLALASRQPQIDRSLWKGIAGLGAKADEIKQILQWFRGAIAEFEAFRRLAVRPSIRAEGMLHGRRGWSWSIGAKETLSLAATVESERITLRPTTGDSPSLDTQNR